MSGDGLYYLPDGFREGARHNASTADAAEGTSRYLGRIQIDTAAYAGADAFPAALSATRDKQARGVAQAAEGRDNMAAADRHVAATGDEMDTAAGTALGGVIQPDHGIADGV